MSLQIPSVLVVLALAACGTTVQVVDRVGPIVGARVGLVSDSYGGAAVVTDAAGFATLRDGWIDGWSPLPWRWITVETPAGVWHFVYPPSAVLRLDEATATGRADPASDATGAQADAK